MAPDTRRVGQFGVAKISSHRNACAADGATEHSEDLVKARQAFLRARQFVIKLKIVVLRGNAHLFKWQAKQAAVLIRRHAPGLTAVGEVHEGMSECRKL